MKTIIDKNYSEKCCMETFLQAKGEDLSQWTISKPSEDELVDIEAKNKTTGEIVKSQIRFLEDKEVGELATKGSFSGIRGADYMSRLIENAIRSKQKYPVNSTKDIYLLLNAFIDIPDFFKEPVLKNLPDNLYSHFKAIYIVVSSKRIVQIKQPSRDTSI